jgi:NAD(P)H-hydrate epimerase
MKLLNAEQIRKWDEYTIQHEPITSLDLMERAALKCTEWLISKQHYDNIKIFCGKGNNGGDGLAIARQLIERNIQPIVYILEFGHKGTDDFQANLQRLHKLTKDIHFIQSETAFSELTKNNIVIDCLFGSGLNRPLEGVSKSLVEHINSAGTTVISIDVPSGMSLDRSSSSNTIIQATSTLTFQTLKLCLLSSENSQFFGDVEVIDIGLHQDYLQSVETNLYLTNLEDAKELYRPRSAFAHKGNFGHALIIGGAAGKSGAAIIATESCLRAGAGLTSVYMLSEEYTSINTRIPEAMTLAGAEMVKQNLTRFSAIGVGPGLGTDDMAQHIITLLLENYQGALVLDADALNVLSSNKELIEQLPPNCILTPHPKEFDRLFGEHEDEFNRWETALQQSSSLNCIIVLKGHYTLVAAKGKGYFNTRGNAGLSKGGSGDALTGIITALLAQQYSAEDAARLGVYIHGLAADIAVSQQSYESLLSSDISANLGKAFQKLLNVS